MLPSLPSYLPTGHASQARRICIIQISPSRASILQTHWTLGTGPRDMATFRLAAAVCVSSWLTLRIHLSASRSAVRCTGGTREPPLTRAHGTRIAGMYARRSYIIQISPSRASRAYYRPFGLLVPAHGTRHTFRLAAAVCERSGGALIILFRARRSAVRSRRTREALVSAFRWSVGALGHASQDLFGPSLLPLPALQISCPWDTHLTFGRPCLLVLPGPQGSQRLPLTRGAHFDWLLLFVNDPPHSSYCLEPVEAHKIPRTRSRHS